ncbi:MAG: hypothetical protein HKN27_14005 [Silicimonas sp.]|nr:hypothetical protein [Silicimonas sp.]
MFASFILGALAAWGAPQIEPQLKSQLARLLPDDDIPALEMRTITLAMALFVAACLASLLGSTSAVALTFGGLVGVLGPRGYQRYRMSKAPDYDA